jgi:carboxyl-terminal processing protease
MENKQDNKFGRGMLLGIVTGTLLTAVVCIITFYFHVADLKNANRIPVENYGSGSSQHTNSLLQQKDVQDKVDLLEKYIDGYYLYDYDEEDLKNGIYKGLMAGLADPYSTYYTAEEYTSMMESSTGRYYGIGVQVSQNINTGIITISKVFKNSPAIEVGLQAGDMVMKVAGTEVTGMDLNLVVTKIKGEEGEAVNIEVFRESTGETLSLDVERRQVEITTIEYEMKEDRIGYIAFSDFEDVSYDQMMAAISTLEGMGMQGLILDLRGNPGGLLTSAVDIADAFLPEGLIVYTEDKYGNRDEYTSDEEHQFNKPLVVLIDGNSASASEVLAGAIKDYGAGTLVGTTSYGKGIVQSLIPLKDKTALKITVADYYTPNGNNIHGIGIEPDVVVERGEGDTDAQLDKAIEVMREKLQ